MEINTQKKGLAIVAINSNDPVSFPDDDREGMKKEISEAGYTFPYLVDDSQDVSKTFRAACTPDFFLSIAIGNWFTADSSTTAAPETMFRSPDPICEPQWMPCCKATHLQPNKNPASDCNIKWKAGNEPEYFGLQLHMR